MDLLHKKNSLTLCKILDGLDIVEKSSDIKSDDKNY